MYAVKTVLELGDQYTGSVTKLEFSPDGAHLAGAQGRHVTIWSVRQKQLLHTEHGPVNDVVVSQDWSSDGLSTVFKSGWVVTIRLDADMTNERYHQSTKLADLASVDPTGMKKAVAQGGSVSIWSRALGQERWTLEENFMVPMELQTVVPVAKSIYWCNPRNPCVTVIYEMHGIITWRLGRGAVAPCAINRPEVLETVQAQVGFGGKRVAFVFRDISAFRIYNYPACTLTDNFATQDAPGPMSFARRGTMLIGAVGDTLYLWDLDGAKEKRSIILSNEGAVGIPITAVAECSTHPLWPQRPHHALAVAQGSTVTIWTTPADDAPMVGYVKAGVALGALMYLLVFILT